MCVYGTDLMGLVDKITFHFLKGKKFQHCIMILQKKKWYLSKAEKIDKFSNDVCER